MITFGHAAVELSKLKLHLTTQDKMGDFARKKLKPPCRMVHLIAPVNAMGSLSTMEFLCKGDLYLWGEVVNRLGSILQVIFRL